MTICTEILLEWNMKQVHAEYREMISRRDVQIIPFGRMHVFSPYLVM